MNTPMVITLYDVSHPLGRFARWRTAQSSPPFHFDMRWDPRVLVQLIAVHIGFLLITFKVGAGNILFQLADTRFFPVGHYTLSLWRVFVS
jgi:hypothetical protein